MPDYKKMYLQLFNAVTDSIEILTKAQQDCEELYIADDEPNLIVLPQESDRCDLPTPPSDEGGGKNL